MSDDLQQRIYPEDERLRAIETDPDRRMTRDEWEREESLARQAAHKKHQQVEHDRQVQQDFDRKKKQQHRPWGKIFLWVGAGLAVLLLIFLIGYLPRHSRNKKTEADARQREQEKPDVDVIKVEQTAEPGELTVPGTTAAITEAYIYARANGYIRKRYVDIGDRVSKGQLLAILDAPDLDQQVDQARQQLRQSEAQEAQQQAQLDFTRVTWERWRTLVSKGVFSRQDGDQQETNYRAQLATVTSSQRNVESYRANLQRVIALQGYERITSPFDGVITQRNADVGALVGSSGSVSAMPNPTPDAPTGGTTSPASSNTNGSSGAGPTTASPTTGGAQGGNIFAVAQIDKLRILVSVPEGYASSVHRGQTANVFLQERGGKPVAGTVTRTASSIDQNTRTMLAEVDIDNHSRTLYPGMYTVVSFQQVRGTPPLTVPGDAVIVRNDQTTVAVLQNNKVHLVPVRIGRDYGPSVEIIGGLRAGDTVVTTVTDGVREGATVQPHMNKQQGEEATGKEAGPGGSQQNRNPDSGPNEYGDQSIVNEQLEGTNNQGKKGANNGTNAQGQKAKGSGPQQTTKSKGTNQ